MSNSKRGAVHSLEAFLAAIIIFTALLYSTSIPRERDRRVENPLKALGMQTLLRLDGNRTLGRLVQAQSWDSLERCLRIILPAGVSFNLTVIDEGGAPVNDQPISNGGLVGRSTASIEYLLVAESHGSDNENMVDDDSSDVDSFEVGSSTNFTAQRFGPDAEFDELTEGFYPIKDYVDSISGVDPIPDKGTHSNFTAEQYGPDSIFDKLKEGQPDPQHGVLEVSLGSAIPIPFDKDKHGKWAAIIFNPTDQQLSVTFVEFRNNGTQQVFAGVQQGYPTSGWDKSGDKMTVYWSGSETVDPYSAKAFWVMAKGNKKPESAPVQVKATINGTDYLDSGWLDELSGNLELASVAMEEGSNYPVYNVTVDTGEEHTFNVSLAEEGGKKAIPSGVTLTIEVPSGFTNIEDIGGTGWGTATIDGNTITVNTTQTVQLSRINYQFNATAPTGIFTSLYMMNVSMSGDSAVQGHTISAFAEVAIKVVCDPNYEVDLEVQFTSVGQNSEVTQLWIKTGTTDPEDLGVSIWNSTDSQWYPLVSDIAENDWTITTITSSVSDTITIRFLGGSELNDTNQDSWKIDAVLLNQYNQTTYQLDLEVQWTDASFSEHGESLCIYGGTMGSEDILVDVWYNDEWHNLFTDLSTGWNNISVGEYLTSSTFTIRFKGGTETSDEVQDMWQIDVSLLHTWNAYTSKLYRLRMQLGG